MLDNILDMESILAVIVRHVNWIGFDLGFGLLCIDFNQLPQHQILSRQDKFLNSMAYFGIRVQYIFIFLIKYK